MHTNVIIGGNFRGGTSITARLAVAAGLALPGEFGKNYEDRRFQSLLHGVKRPNKKALKDLISANNQSYKQWVLKYPAIFKNFKVILPLLQNPKIILITRDPVAVAQSEKRNHSKKEYTKLLERTGIYNQAIVDAYVKYQKKYSSLLLSYEKLVLQPHETVNQICSFLGQGEPQEIVKLITERETTPWPVEPNLPLKQK
jgi:hypothetical protein